MDVTTESATERTAGRAARHARGARALAMALAAMAMAVPGVARAQDEPLPDDNAGTGQYVEPVPDAGGDRPSAPGARGDDGRVPRELRDALPPGEERRLLRRIASDPGAGAPERDGRGGGGGGGGGGGRAGGDEDRGAAAGGEEDEGAASALISAAFDSDSSAPALTLLAILGLVLGALFVRLRQRS